MEGSAEKRLADLFSRNAIPPLDVIIPILRETGRGERELTAMIYEAYVNIANGMKEIMGYTEPTLKTLAKVWEMSVGYDGSRFKPIELSETRYSFSVPDCPMLHVGRDVSFEVKSKFCDLVCSGGSRGLMDAILAPAHAICTWDKALIRGERQCTVVFEVVRTG